MKVFTYNHILKYVYRYGNIPVTILLLIYVFPFIYQIDRRISYLLPILIILFLIYLVNRHYLSLYQVLPYRIEADEEKLTAGDFLFSKRTVVIHFNDITELKGGLFEGYLRGLMKINDGRNHNTIAFYQNIKGAADLQTIILSRIPKELYEKTLENIKTRRKITHK